MDFILQDVFYSTTAFPKDLYSDVSLLYQEIDFKNEQSFSDHNLLASSALGPLSTLGDVRQV